MFTLIDVGDRTSETLPWSRRVRASNIRVEHPIHLNIFLGIFPVLTTTNLIETCIVFWEKIMKYLSLLLKWALCQCQCTFCQIDRTLLFWKIYMKYLSEPCLWKKLCGIFVRTLLEEVRWKNLCGIIVGTLLGEAELAMEKTPESAWLAGESLLFVSRGDSENRLDYI